MTVTKVKAIVFTLVFLSSIFVILVKAGIVDPRALERSFSGFFEKQPDWDETVEQITNRDLLGWLKDAPFNGLYYPLDEQSGKGKLVFTNSKQVFPFMGKFKNSDRELYTSRSMGEVYQEDFVVYKDPEFGELFLYAILTFEPEELFVSELAMESGSVVFSGMNSINESYSAALKETQVFSHNDQYKTAIYIANKDYARSSYLFAIYQTANLALQVGIPITAENTDQVIAKLKEISQTMALNVAEWENLNAEDLAINDNPQSFWMDPYYGIVIKRYMLGLPDVYLKLALSPFQAMNDIAAREHGSDYYFAYDGKHGEVALGLSVKQTALSKQDYFSQHAPGTNEYPVNTSFADEEHKVFVEQKNESNIVTGTAETYFKDNQLLQFDYSYPIADKDAARHVETVLSNIKINML